MRTIELVDEAGNRTCEIQEGRMCTTSHSSVLAALENRASRFRERGRLSCMDDHLVSAAWAVDETGTVDASYLLHSESDISEQQTITELQERNRVMELGISEEVLKVHGVAPQSKGEGVIRLIYENVNGLSNKLYDNEKVEKAKEIHDELEVDIVAYNEHRLNMRDRRNINGFNQLFKGGEAALQSVVSHNVHENIGRIQEGGTSLLLFGPLTEQLDNDQPGKDESGLGRWSVMTLRGDGVRTRVVCGYNPCYNKNQFSNTTYQQHRRYLITQRSDLTCPRKKFREDLVAQLTQWRNDGDRLIVCLDANEHIYKKSIGKALTDIEGLAMKEVVGDFTGIPIGSTFFRGSKPIDGVWASSDITVSNAAIMPAGFGIGDHRLFVIDFVMMDIIGKSPPKIVRPASRRLNTKIPRVAAEYARILENKILKHRLIERTGAAHIRSKSRRKAAKRLNCLDDELGQYMRHAEKKCRKIKSGRIPFSPEASQWIRRTQVYRSLLKYHAGRIHNRGNLKRTARRCNIPDAMSLTIREIKMRLKTCVSQCDHFRKHGNAYRRKHLHQRLDAAKEKEDEEAEKQILAIIQREKDRGFWRRLNYALGKSRGGACFKVQVDQGDGTVQEYTEKEHLQEAIWNNIHRKRFYLAEEAPICSGPLRGTFGYNAVSPTARMILEGTFEYPPNFDEATKEILQECARIRLRVPKDSVGTNVSKEDWLNHWGRTKEGTSSSVSGRHFGHYKAGLRSEYISYLQALQATLIVKRGIVLERWSRGLSVMLEKIFGCSLITKLRSILLMEADFNATNKTIYGIRMLANVRKYKLMPDEVFSERNRLADDGTLSKVLFYDIVRQLRRPAGLASVDADNCYDRIAHPMASMVFQAFGVPTPAIESMLTTIQEMKFFLRTGYGDSAGYAGGAQDESEDPVRTQGMCQGNGASPAAWTVTSIPMIAAHKKKGHGSHLIATMSGMTGHLIGGLFVDDTDLIHMDMRTIESTMEAHENLQESVINWGKLLIATGGALKPAKCSYYLISFDWKADGTWRYSKNEIRPDLQICVPLADGSLAEIEHLPINEAVKTLGSMTCPSGSNIAAIQRMQTQGQEWVDRVKSGKLSRRNVWFMLDCQFWPRLGFGICNNTASWEDLEFCLKKVYWQLVPRGGVRGSAPAPLRQLDRGFYGIGCPHPGVECFLAQIQKLLIHYGCRSGLGIQMQVSSELLITELGISSQPFQESYGKYGKWTTHSWLKSIWEKADKFQVTIEIANLPIEPPREGDKWFMQAAMEAGVVDPTELRKLNKYRCHQQVLYLSDVMDAGGKCLDKRYLNRRQEEENWSTLIFPAEKPPPGHISLWRQVLYAVAPRGRMQSRLGRFQSKGHKIWEWRYCEEERKVYHHKGQVMDIYRPSTAPTYVNRPNFWSRTRVDAPLEEVGEICSMKEVGNIGTHSVLSHTPMPPTKAAPRNFWEAIHGWGNTWLWDNLVISGDISWIAVAIADNSCVAVTDGSYMKEVYPNMNSAAFVFECSKGRGRLMGTFVETTPDAGSYRGELLGLMAIHLILRGIHDVRPDLRGSVHILSDCLGALYKVENLPPYRIPTKCSHSDILKNIMVNCSLLSFKRIFSHVKAHQDDGVEYGNLPRNAQLNCQMDYHAKKAIWESTPDPDRPTQRFPLEPICVFLGKNKLTSDKGAKLKFWVQRQQAKSYFHDASIIFGPQFDTIDWEMIHETLSGVPRMFQVWACKQVMDIAPANGNRPWEQNLCPLCPSCAQANETCSHILFCNHAGRVDALMKSIDLLEQWLVEVDTDPDLVECIVEYARGRGQETMSDICRGRDSRYAKMADEQDNIGWRRFMEGMVTRSIRRIQETYTIMNGSNLSPQKWAVGVVTKLLEATHGQWLYRCVQIHDRVNGTLATQRKEELQREIETQQEMGMEGLMEEDQYLAEVNLEDLESTTGERQEYWLVAIRAAREASILQGNQIIRQRHRRTATRGHLNPQL